MKNLIRAAGALSLGAASLALTNSALAAEGGEKPWTASASLRGFYDDNIFTGNEANVDPVTNLPIDNKIGSWGFDVSPSLTYGRTIDNTSFDLGYTYLARWFENRPSSNWDQNHNLSAGLQHIFSPRVKASLADVFVSAQDPGQFAPLSGQVLRAEGDNISNSASAEMAFGVSDRVDATVSYRNNFFDYDNAAFETALNRVEHLPSLDLGYLLTQTTTVGVGYQYGIYDYDLSPGRSFDSHIVYAGVKHQFTQNFFGSLNAGIQVADYDAGGSDTTPYLDGKLVYQYTLASDITFNVRHTLNATDVLLAANQETTLFRVSWGHAFSAKIKATVLGQFQSSDFSGALSANETFWTLGTTVSYALTPHVALDASYFHDNLNSDRLALGFERGYDRNRLFLGVRASF
jgi:hypothetical protein